MQYEKTRTRIADSRILRYANLVLMSPRTGRPKSDNPRSRVVPLRLTEDEHSLIAGAANQDGKPLSEYIRSAAVNKAKKAK